MSTAAAEKEKPAPEAVTPEIQKNLNDIARNMLFGGGKEAPKEEVVVDPDAPADEPAVVVAKPQAKARRPVKKPVTPEVNHDELVARTAKATAEAVAEAMRLKVEPKVEVDPTEGLTAEDKAKVPILERMSVLFPDRYPPEFVEKYKTSVKKAAEYEKKWIEEHPDDEYDPEAEEHNEFFKANAIDWTDADEMEARADIIAERRIKVLEGKSTAAIDELRRKHTLQETQPAAVAESKRVSNIIFQKMGGDYKDLLTPEGMTKVDVLNKIKAADPLEFDVVVNEIVSRERRSITAQHLYDRALAFDNTDAVHMAINDANSELERQIKSVPAQQQLDKQGRKFATLQNFDSMTKAEQSRHWTLRPHEVNDWMNRNADKEIKAAVEKQRKYVNDTVSRYGFVPAAKANNGAPAARAAAPEVEDFAPAQVTSKGVTIPGGSKGKVAAAPDEAGSLLIKKLLGK